MSASPSGNRSQPTVLTAGWLWFAGAVTQISAFFIAGSPDLGIQLFWNISYDDPTAQTVYVVGSVLAYVGMTIDFGGMCVRWLRTKAA